MEVQLGLLHDVAQGLALAKGPACEADGAAHPLQNAEANAQLLRCLLYAPKVLHVTSLFTICDASLSK